MSNHKNIEIVEDNIRVIIPIELKDVFKSNFKKSHWLNHSKKWELNLSSLDKLNQFLEESNDLLVEIEAAETMRLKDELLHKLRSDLKYIKGRIRKNKSLYVSVSDEDIESVRLEIERAKKSLEQERSNTQSRFERNKELVKSVCDMSIVSYSLSKMVEMQYARRTSAIRKVFESAAVAIDDEHDKLKEIGFYSPAMNNIYNLNWNRPDRDKANKFSVDDIYEIKKYEK